VRRRRHQAPNCSQEKPGRCGASRIDQNRDSRGQRICIGAGEYFPH
jgi:hypothetical protein